jgi:hypothetical protein
MFREKHGDIGTIANISLQEAGWFIHSRRVPKNLRPASAWKDQAGKIFDLSKN